MKKIKSYFFIIIMVLEFLSGGAILDACTTFCLKTGDRLVFGRNYDWNVGVGLVIINKRNLKKRAFVGSPDVPVEWVSKYGSITFNQYGKETPQGGMNEAGLVVELMMLSAARYPDPDDRPAVSELAWIQYQLDNFRFTSEVIASDSAIRIVNTCTPLHFLVCDRFGQVATIEFLNGMMVSHSDESLPVEVLANNTYAESLQYLKRHREFGGKREISHSANSLDRFVRAAHRIKGYKEEERGNIVDYAFDILSDVQQMGSTQWSIVYDIRNLSVYFKTLRSPKIKVVSLDDFDFSCETPSRVLDIDVNRQEVLENNFNVYQSALNKKLIYEAYKKTEFLQNIPDEILDQIANFPDSYVCRSLRELPGKSLEDEDENY